ncbi:hypothetical protein AB3S75_019137 [Citrus x aurantiifolia]
MASPRDSLTGLKNRVIVMCIISFTIFSPKSAGSALSRGSEGLKQVKMVLGSRPPQCVHKCLNCTPCVATLVIPPHPKKRLKASSSSSSPSSSQEDENYYLLSWRCKCGNKLFHP